MQLRGLQCKGQSKKWFLAAQITQLEKASGFEMTNRDLPGLQRSSPKD